MSDYVSDYECQRCGAVVRDGDDEQCPSGREGQPHAPPRAAAPPAPPAPAGPCAPCLAAAPRARPCRCPCHEAAWRARDVSVDPIVVGGVTVARLRRPGHPPGILIDPAAPGALRAGGIAAGWGGPPRPLVGVDLASVPIPAEVLEALIEAALEEVGVSAQRYGLVRLTREHQDDLIEVVRNPPDAAEIHRGDPARCPSPHLAAHHEDAARCWPDGSVLSGADGWLE